MRVFRGRVRGVACSRAPLSARRVRECLGVLVWVHVRLALCFWVRANLNNNYHCGGAKTKLQIKNARLYTRATDVQL